MERECTELREECLALKTEKSFRDEELCRLLDIGDSNRTDGMSVVDEVRREIDRLREKLNLQDVELARAVSDYEVSF